jgi:hypothetical protein
MNPNDLELSILQNLEFALVKFWHSHSGMTDHTALRAYEAAFEKYRAELRGRPAKPLALNKLDAEARAEVLKVCEWRLGRASLPGTDDKRESPVPLETLAGCLRELMKSVERHTKSGGRIGYLTFVERYVR